MKKRLLSMLLCVALGCSLFVGCGSKNNDADATKKENVSESKKEEESKEKPLIRVACTPYSGQILDAIASAKGFYDDEGIQVELYFTHVPSDAQAALLAGHCDVLSTYGTPAPLKAISAGNDFTIFAGYMLEGDNPYIGRPGTEVKSIEDLVGKKIIGSLASDYIIANKLLDAGYDPNTDVTWVARGDTAANAEAVRKGEADYVSTTTGYETTAKEMGLIDAFYPDDFEPEYSCCRVYTSTEWLNNNQESVVALLTAWLRAQEILEKDPDYAVKQVVEQTELTEDYVKQFIYSDHFMIRLDPHWKAVSTAWEQINRVGGFQGETDIEYMKQHFNCELYKKALDRCVEKYYDEDPEYYDFYQKYYQDVNADFLK